jgi:hypothetical protein
MTEKLHTSRRTPLDANYEACESTYVELLIYSDGESSLITESLGIKPSYAQNKGELIENSRGITRKAKMTYWSLSSEGRVLSKDVRHHLIWLLDQLHGKEFVLARLQQQAISMTVNCNWWSSGSGGPTLWPEQMSALAKFNLECTFDIYCSD